MTTQSVEPRESRVIRKSGSSGYGADQMDLLSRALYGRSDAL